MAFKGLGESPLCRRLEHGELSTVELLDEALTLSGICMEGKSVLDDMRAELMTEQLGGMSEDLRNDAVGVRVFHQFRRQLMSVLCGGK